VINVRVHEDTNLEPRACSKYCLLALNIWTGDEQRYLLEAGRNPGVSSIEVAAVLPYRRDAARALLASSIGTAE